jgi:hypothetical protein
LSSSIKLAAGIAVGAACLGLAPPAVAHGGDGDCPECESRMMGGGGGMDGDRRMMKAHRGSAGHKHYNMVIQPYWNMNQDAIYTLFGMEMIKQDSLGWKGGFGMYGGMNFGVTNQTNTFHYGGAIMGKDFTAGPLTLGIGALLGFGKTANILPAVLPAGINNYYMFGVGAPRIGLAWTVYDRMEIGLDASYLFTTNPNIGHSPAVSLRLSTISWGGHHGH